MDSRVPAQSQPQHNFSLPALNLNKEIQSSRCLRSHSVKSPSQRSHPSTRSRPQDSQRPSPLSDSASKQLVLVSRSNSMKSESGTKGNGSKISIKIPCKNGKKNQEERCERGAGENKEKKKLSFEVSLSQLEIEEDIYGFTGLRPNRRPKKRAKNVQKQLDDVFPGSWLESITPDSYKVLFIQDFESY
ncbi:uncharacterized protein LOC111378331 [Olea europaea var. sylvestris]|nr:uncharacterized protein LOC111378331 [Olea europaea var. sylvestris]CAA3012806.1 Hypothetical predicted protein [Olea europaea subsp. europaea]